MAVVAAGVQDAGILTHVAAAVFLHDRQRIHIDAQTDTAGAVTLPEATDQTMSADVARDLITSFGQVPGDQFGGRKLLERQLGVPMQMMTDSGQEIFRVVQIGNLAMALVVFVHGAQSAEIVKRWDDAACCPRPDPNTGRS